VEGNKRTNSIPAKASNRRNKDIVRELKGRHEMLINVEELISGLMAD
jgi:hypothetical protein